MIDEIHNNFVYEYLKDCYKNNIQKQSYKIINNKRYVKLPIKELKEKGFSLYRQNKILDDLGTEKNLSVVMGQARIKWFTFDDESTYELSTLKKEIKERLIREKDIVKLTKVLVIIAGDKYDK